MAPTNIGYSVDNSDIKLRNKKYLFEQLKLKGCIAELANFGSYISIRIFDEPNEDEYFGQCIKYFVDCVITSTPVDTNLEIVVAGDDVTITMKEAPYLELCDALKATDSFKDFSIRHPDALKHIVELSIELFANKEAAETYKDRLIRIVNGKIVNVSKEEWLS